MAEVDISKIKLPDGTICNLKASGGSSAPLTNVSYDTNTAAFKKTYNGSTEAYQYCETLGATPGSKDPITSGGVSNSLDGLAGSKNRATYSSRTDTNSFASAIRVPLSRPLVSIDNTIYFGSLTVSGTGSIQFGFGSGSSVHFQFESVTSGTYTNRTYETCVWSDGDICDTFFIVAVSGSVSVTFSNLMICPTADFDSQNPYKPPVDTVSSLTENKIDTAGSGLSKLGTTLNHTTTINAKTTSGLFKAKINYTGHIIDWTDVSIESSAPTSGSSSLITSGAVYSALPGSATANAEGTVSLSSTYKGTGSAYGLLRLYAYPTSSYGTSSGYAATPSAVQSAYSNACDYADDLMDIVPEVVYCNSGTKSTTTTLSEVSGLSYTTNASYMYRITASLTYSQTKTSQVEIWARPAGGGTAYCWASNYNNKGSDEGQLTCSCLISSLQREVFVKVKSQSGGNNMVSLLVEKLPIIT